MSSSYLQSQTIRISVTGGDGVSRELAVLGGLDGLVKLGAVPAGAGSGGVGLGSSD